MTRFHHDDRLFSRAHYSSEALRREAEADDRDEARDREAAAVHSDGEQPIDSGECWAGLLDAIDVLDVDHDAIPMDPYWARASEEVDRWR